MAHTRVYRNGALEAEDFPVADVSEHLERPDTVVWVDFCGPSKEQLHELADELGLHELAVEDALGPHQRPKLDHYATHLFLSCHAVRVDQAKGTLDETEIDAFISERWLITVRKDEGFSMDPVLARWDRSPDLAVHGVSFLLYGLLDVVVDGYFDDRPGLRRLLRRGQRGHLLREARSSRPSNGTGSRCARRSCASTASSCRCARPSAASCDASTPPSSRDLYPYYQDVYDHVLRVSESTDALRDLVSTIVETNLSLRDYRQNQVMKKVTSWAAIIAVPTLITGWYGMNVPYPGFGETLGVIVSALLIVLGSGGLYVAFKRNDWL